MASIRAEQRIRKALTTKLSPATKYNLDVGDFVRLYCEKSRKWEGTFKVSRLNKGLESVTDGNNTKLLSITAVITTWKKGRDDDMKNLILIHTLLEDTHTNLTKSFETRDPRCKSDDSLEAMKKDIGGLMEGVYSP